MEPLVVVLGIAALAAYANDAKGAGSLAPELPPAEWYPYAADASLEFTWAPEPYISPEASESPAPPFAWSPVPPWIAGEQIEPYPLPDAREPARDAPDTTAGTLEPADFSAPIGVRDPAPAPSFMSDDTPGANVAAFLELIRQIEARGRYDVIAGNDRFSDFSEHPFILDPRRRRPLGTTASGAYQMIKSTWIAARDALGLPDFSPASQDAAAVWILQFKRPRAWPLVQQGRFLEALKALRNEWEAFDKMIAGTYPINLARAQAIYEQAGGIVA